VIAYDRRSFGTARASRPANLTTHATDTAAVIHATGAPATLIGWSIGAVIALETAATAPDLVDQLVLIEPPLHAKRHPHPRMIAAILTATILGKPGNPTAGARRFLQWALGNQDSSTDLDAMPRQGHGPPRRRPARR
jgi:pimeloyl-ACP methyl ester carboxylesterase